jgi:hypothetical protein
MVNSNREVFFMAKRHNRKQQQEVFPARRVWVVDERKLAASQAPEPEIFGYNDWEIYHGA